MNREQHVERWDRLVDGAYAQVVFQDGGWTAGVYDASNQCDEILTGARIADVRGDLRGLGFRRLSNA